MQRIGSYALGSMVREDRLWRVYDATDAGGRGVHLKVIHGDLVRTDAARQAVAAGMQALTRLHHPNLVQHLGSELADGQCATVVEPVAGTSLRARIQEHRRLAWPNAVNIAMQIAQGLQAAHAIQPAIVHGDIKPDNVMLGASDSVKLVDFDLTWALQEVAGTATAGFRNLRYMSPEQIDAYGVDPRSDLYALGLVLYEMLFGQPPFNASAPRELLNAQCTQPPPPFPDALRAELPAGLETLVQRLLQKRKEDRPQSATEVCGLLDGIRQGRPDPSLLGAAAPAMATAVGGGAPAVMVAAPRSGSSGAVIAIVGVLALTLVGGVGAYFAMSSEEAEPIAAAPTIAAAPSPAAEGEPVAPTPANAVPSEPSPPPEDPPVPAQPTPIDPPPTEPNPTPETPVAPPSQQPPDAIPQQGSVFDGLVPEGPAPETRGQRISRWVGSRLTGHDNRVASFRVVDIKKAGNGHTIFIKNQFKWTCGVTFNAAGSPKTLTNCRSGEAGWGTPTKTITLKCKLDEKKELCRGQYKLTNGGFGSRETMQIVRRLPKPKPKPESKRAVEVEL